MASLMAKLKQNSTVKHTSMLSESNLFNVKDSVPTDIPAINIVLSGRVDGGLSSGLTVIAGESKNYKSNLSLLLASAYLRKYEDAVCLLYDSEFGITPEYLRTMDIDPSRVIHTPIEHVEQLKFDITKQLENIERGDKVVIVVDSVGNLASKKELDDALDGKSVADMTRAKALKGLFRLVTPYLTTRDIPMIVINHTYQTIEMFSKQTMSGGTGIYYSSNQIIFMGRQQVKDGKDVSGYNFMMGVEKSRFVREKTRIPLEITWDGGINRWSGLIDIGRELGWVHCPSNGWYEGINPNTGEIISKKSRKADTNTSLFWEPILESGLAAAIEARYTLATMKLVVEGSDIEVVDDAL